MGVKHTCPPFSVALTWDNKNGVEPLVLGQLTHALRLEARAQATLAVEALAADVASVGVTKGHRPNEAGGNVHHHLEGDLCKFEY